MHIGIDLGRSKIALVCLDGAGQTLFETREKTPADYHTCVRTIAALVKQAEATLGRRCTIGIGTPGAVSARTGLMKNAGMFDNHALHLDLEEAMARPVAMSNDANCFALSEATDGAGAGLAVVFGVIIGTGVGGGLVVHGRPLVGPNAIAGEWGHNPLPWPEDTERPGPRCFCGKRGCIETFLSAPSMMADHLARTGKSLDAQDIANSNDEDALGTIQDYQRRLAKALASVINIVDPDAIILGGGLSNIDQLYENVANLWTGFVTSDQIDTRLLRAKYGDTSGVRGAAWLGKSTE
jgi:fructokinase